MMKPISLTQSELDQVINRVAPNGKEFGAARICRLLAKHPQSLTVRVNTLCSVGNISDLVNKAINPRIDDLGLYVACEKLPHKIQNRFGQPSGQMLWSFYRDEAANDPVFHGDLEADLKQIKEQYPDLEDTDGSSVDDWIETLTDAGVE